MPAFSADREDEERLKTYILQRVPPGLKRELDIYSSGFGRPKKAWRLYHARRRRLYHARRVAY